MIFTSPLMLLGFATLPILAAVYWLRSRSRRAVVSNLAFWIDQRTPRHGGRILQRMQTPLCFFLELLTITLLVLAASGPVMVKRDVVRSLLVVLDDSYSMLAGTGIEDHQSSRDRAENALIDELRSNRYVTRFISAGPQPRMTGEPMHDPTRLEEILSQWTCQCSTADLPAAMALAAEMGGPTARILVLTDHAPTATLDAGQTEWRSFGDKLPNMAFTAATRTRSGEGQRVLLEVTNLSDSASSTTLTMEGGNLTAPKQIPVKLDGAAARQFFLNLPAESPALRARLGNDTLAIDNQAVLLPESSKPLRVQVDLADINVRQAVQKALQATGQMIETKERPELVIADKSAACNGEIWRVEIIGGKDSSAYAGPFVIDRNHDLTQGLSLQNVIWSAPADKQAGGLPIVTAGNTPLLTESEDFAGRRKLRMPFSADTSNLQDMPDWPIFFANLMQWRRNGLPGAVTPNVRLGQTVSITVPGEIKQVEVVSPSKVRRKLEVRGRRIAVPADRVGMYAIKAGQIEYPFSCNTVSRDESDLTDCQTGRWGNWNDSETYQDRQIDLSWIFLLAAIATMAAHMAVIAKNTEGRNA